MTIYYYTIIPRITSDVVLYVSLQPRLSVYLLLLVNK